MFWFTVANPPAPCPTKSGSAFVPGAYQRMSPLPSPVASREIGRYVPPSVRSVLVTPAGGVGGQSPRWGGRPQRPDDADQVMPEPGWLERGRSFRPMVRQPEMAVP